MPAHKSALSVGPLYIPVSLQKTTKDISISFNQLTADTHERIQYKKYCANCSHEVPSHNIVKGYEYEKGKYIVLTEDEIQKLKSKKDKTIHIEHTAKMSEIDTLMFEKNYYIIPDPGAEKAYELIRQALYSKKCVAVAKTVMGTKEELLVIYPEKTYMVAKILFYQEELQAAPAIKKVDISKAEVEMAKTMIEAIAKPFEASAYKDEYQAKLRDAITTKIQGQEIVSVDKGQDKGNIIDLMDAMQQIVKGSNKGTA